MGFYRRSAVFSDSVHLDVESRLSVESHNTHNTTTTPQHHTKKHTHKTHTSHAKHKKSVPRLPCREDCFLAGHGGRGGRAGGPTLTRQTHRSEVPPSPSVKKQAGWACSGWDAAAVVEAGWSGGARRRLSCPWRFSLPGQGSAGWSRGGGGGGSLPGQGSAA